MAGDVLRPTRFSSATLRTLSSREYSPPITRSNTTRRPRPRPVSLLSQKFQTPAIALDSLLARASATASRNLHTTTSRRMADTAAPTTTGSSASPTIKPKNDWSADQYLLFADQRTRAVRDLVTHITPLIHTNTPRIFDLGCGPGNSTAVLSETWERAKITGIDGSEDMLLKARSRFACTGINKASTNTSDSSAEPGGQWVNFVKADIRTFTPPSDPPVTLIFSNAVFHWLRHPSRLSTLRRLFCHLERHAVLAVQVPDNYHAPTHKLMRITALLPDQPWTKYFADAHIGDFNDAHRPDLDPIEPPEEWYETLAPLAMGSTEEGQNVAINVDVWRTEYMHVVDGVGAIVEWVKGTGLQPFLHRMDGDEEAKQLFLKEYERRLGLVYGPLKWQGNRVMLGYRRLFVVAVRG